jgi:MFS family permease
MSRQAQAITPTKPQSMPAPTDSQQQRIAWTLLGTVSFGAMLSSMTASVINVALPDIARDFLIDPSRAAWVILSFLLTVTVLLLVAGRLGDMLGAGRVYLMGFAIFGAASLGSAVAPSEAVLIATRAGQAVGAAMIMATAPALLTQSVPA